MKILTVVGARPQFIKAAAVSGPLRARHQETLVHTGQHYDDELSGAFFRELSLPRPDYELGVGSASHGEQTAAMLVGIEAAILKVRPDRVLVYGDTNSTLAGALAAAKLHVPVAHVEAGLRSFNRRMPEEINRVVADRVADLLFCPSDAAAGNLAREGIVRGVHVVGDVMGEVLRRVTAGLECDAGFLDRFGVRAGGYLLATVHRAENADDPVRLSGILAGLAAAGEPVIFPAHPRVRQALDRMAYRPPASVKVINPVGYADMIRLERDARVILTDSGGVQKEAYWLGVPCLTLRDETEWVETVEAGWNLLVGAEGARILEGIRTFTPPSSRPGVYGNGDVADRIVAILSHG